MVRITINDAGREFRFALEWNRIFAAEGETLPPFMCWLKVHELDSDNLIRLRVEHDWRFMAPGRFDRMIEVRIDRLDERLGN